MKAVIFYNWSGEEFKSTWDSQPFSFQPGEKMLLDEGIALTFAKHLADREMDKKGVSPLQKDVHKEYAERAVLEPSRPIESDNKEIFESKVANSDQTSKEDLQAKLTELGVAFDKRWGIEKLEKALKENKPEETKEEFEGVE